MKTVSALVNTKLENTRQRHKLERDNRIKEAYRRFPRLAEIELEKKKLGFELVKLVLREGSSIDRLEEKSHALEMEKDEILKLGGYPKDYLELKYDCQLCGDTGVVHTSTCSCKKRLIAEQLYSMSGIESVVRRENFDKFDATLFRPNRNPGEKISPREAMQHYASDALRYVRDFDNLKSKNKLFYGPVGTGKTYLCNCIAKGLLDRGKLVVYQTSPKLLGFIADYNFSRAEDKRELEAKRELLTEAELLIIDDLGTELSTSVTTANLFELINDRLISGKATIISTNLELSEIAEVYDRRLLSRILGEYEIYHVYGDDLRMKKFAGL